MQPGAAASQRTVGWWTCFWMSVVTSPVLASYQRRFHIPNQKGLVLHVVKGSILDVA